MRDEWFWETQLDPEEFGILNLPIARPGQSACRGAIQLVTFRKSGRSTKLQWLRLHTLMLTGVILYSCGCAKACVEAVGRHMVLL